MEHHASNLSVFLTWLFNIQKHPWGNFCHGMPMSFLERYDHLLSSLLAALITIILVTIIRIHLKKIPGPLQQIAEFAIHFIRNLASENISHNADRHIPIIGTMGIFILLNNLFGLIPGLSPGTANWNITLGCALVVFIYYNYHGIKEHGLAKYLGHFAGPVWFLWILLWPLEILGLFARILSHSLRLFGNIAGEHLVASIFFTLLPLLIPIPLMVMGLFFGLIQTFVFIMLSTIYISGAVSHEH